MQELLAANPVYAGRTTDEQPDALQRRLDDARAGQAQIKQALATLEERIRGSSSGRRALAEIEEEIESTRITLAALEAHGQALSFAALQLEQAADEHHRNFLPRLNRIVGHSLGQITAGRYSEVQIDHADLQLRLRAPGRPDPVTPEVLSRGAQEQIYLLLRLGLTEVMSNGRERLPLILDDPLVNYDRDRLLRGLDFLAKLAAQAQILLFTKDEQTVHWFRAQFAGDERQRLHRW